MPESIYTIHYNFYSKENSAIQVTDSIITPLSEKEICQARKTKKIYSHSFLFKAFDSIYNAFNSIFKLKLLFAENNSNEKYINL